MSFYAQYLGQKRIKARFCWTSAVGMDVAHSGVDLENGLRTALRRRFRHAVDNIGDSLGVVADWVTVSCGWRSYSPAARGRGGDSNHQFGDWSTSCLEVSCGERG